MQAVSVSYKEEMKKRFRNRSHMRVTIGLINQYAQASAVIPDTEAYAYYSDLKKPLDNYQVQMLYALCDQDYTTVDGSMYFLPRRKGDALLNQGIVTEELLGVVEICFPVPYDIKGLTIEFGKAFPTAFMIVSDHNTVEISGNASGHFVTEEIFEAATYLQIQPQVMSNGQSRFHIHQIHMGIGIYFDNQKILTATKKEHISPIMEELPAIDFSLTVNNKDRGYDIENEESSVNFLEIGQEIQVLYGLELHDAGIEWMPGATVYLRSWSADDEKMTFSASDRFEDLDGTYYRGLYRAGGISLYDLAVDVMEDAGVDSRTYWFDNYLKDVVVQNPMPPVRHKEALQLIANAGRCLLYQDRAGMIFMKSSFMPDMAASAEQEAYFSHAETVLRKTEKRSYALEAANYTDVISTQYFLPKESSEAVLFDTGYVSGQLADAEGRFSVNPVLQIDLEARFKCFGLTLTFGRNHPREMVFHAYLFDELQEDYTVSNLEPVTVISHEFPEFDRLAMEFTKGEPLNRVIVEQVAFGDSTDYELSYGRELTKTPKGTQLEKVRELQVVRTLYNQSHEKKELLRETITVSSMDSRYTFYFSNPSYDLSCELSEPAAGSGLQIVESSNYFVTVELSGIFGACEVVILGKEYVVTQARISRQLGHTGSLETWENPLVSAVEHGADLADWVGDYLKADREYNLSYRGEPRLDANDILFLENKYVSDLLLRVYEHKLTFNGALSGTIKARREITDVAAAKNRLAAR